MAQCIVIGPVCGFVTAGGRAGGVRTLLQPARAQCLRLSERFFICVVFYFAVTQMSEQLAAFLLLSRLTVFHLLLFLRSFYGKQV